MALCAITELELATSPACPAKSNMHACVERNCEVMPSACISDSSLTAGIRKGNEAVVYFSSAPHALLCSLLALCSSFSSLLGKGPDTELAHDWLKEASAARIPQPLIQHSPPNCSTVIDCFYNANSDSCPLSGALAVTSDWPRKIRDCATFQNLFLVSSRDVRIHYCSQGEKARALSVISPFSCYYVAVFLYGTELVIVARALSKLRPG